MIVAPTWIGPLGRMVQVRSPAPDLAAPADRRSNEIGLLSGQTVVQHTRLASRRWEWTIPYGDPDEVAGLFALDQGVYGPPPYRWYDPMAADLNLLGEPVAALGVHRDPGYWLSRPVESGGPVDQFATSVTVDDLVTLPYRQRAPDPVPVLDGKTYTGSVYVSGLASVALVWVDVDGGELAVVWSPSGDGRLSVSGAVPAGAVGLLLRVVPDQDPVDMAGLQLTETDEAAVWHPGMGVPHVTLVGLQSTYLPQSRRTVSVTLVEVA